MKSGLSGKNGSNGVGRHQAQGMKLQNAQTVRTHRTQGVDARRPDVGGLRPE